MFARTKLPHAISRVLHIAIAVSCALAMQHPIDAKEGDPVAIRFWPNHGVSIETMWNLNVSSGISPQDRDALPRVADVDVTDKFWVDAKSSSYVLDRKPNDLKSVLKPAADMVDPSSNAVRISRIELRGTEAVSPLYLTSVTVDGVNIIDCKNYTVQNLAMTVRGLKELPKELKSVDALLINDTRAESEALQALRDVLKPRIAILRETIEQDRIGDSPIERVKHNTFALSKADSTSETRWIKLGEAVWKMEPPLAELFNKKEAASKSSRAVFDKLSMTQMNFRPGNGTHTPRWNAEHMMGRELLFFSQIYNAVDPSIPVIDLNPKQMPPDYKAAHPDWTGQEESNQMERVEAFTRRFAYLLDGMDLDLTAKGSRIWTPKSLLKQMEKHYSEHTANVVKKKDLPDWPSN